MAGEDEATVDPEVFGTGDGPRWITGEYDTNPVHIGLPAELVDRLADGSRIRHEHLPRLARVTTDKIEGGEGRLGRRHPDGRGMLMLAIETSDWDE